MALSQEQFNSIRQQAADIINSLERKEALLLSRQLERQLASLETNNPQLFSEAETLVAKLKWVACPLIKNDQEFLEMFRKNLLAGLEIDFLTDLVSERLALQFGFGLEETVRGILLAIRENNQLIGATPIRIKNETKAAQPTIRHWLLDFLRNAPSDNPAEIDELNYIFSNSNAKSLPDPDKKIVKKILALYDTVALIDIYLSHQPRQQREMITAPTTEEMGSNKETKTAPGLSVKDQTAPSSPRLAQPPSPPPTTISQKTLRQLAQENKEAFNQNLTTAPIKITDFDQPVRPTIKNWLVDYVKIKGAGHHETLARNDYLFNSVNAQSLTAKERELVASILNAYDNDTPLPINAQDQTILLNEISTESPPAVNRLSSKPIQPAVPRGERSELYGSYREPISQEDLSGPMKPAPSKPAPRLSGNIIDLSNISDK